MIRGSWRSNEIVLVIFNGLPEAKDYKKSCDNDEDKRDGCYGSHENNGNKLCRIRIN